MDNLKTQKKLEALVGKVAKTSYVGLTHEECKVILLLQNIAQVQEGKNAFRRYVAGDKYGVPIVKDYDWKFFYWMEKKQRANNKKMFLLKIKNNWSSDDIMDIAIRHALNNAAHCKFSYVASDGSKTLLRPNFTKDDIIELSRLAEQNNIHSESFCES